MTDMMLMISVLSVAIALILLDGVCGTMFKPIVAMLLSVISLVATVVVFGAEGVYAGMYVFLCFQVTYTIMKDNEE